MASQVIEQLPQLESLCQALYLSQVACLALVRVRNRRLYRLQTLLSLCAWRRIIRKGHELSSILESLASLLTLCLCAR
jgi:hypothetical protein